MAEFVDVGTNVGTNVVELDYRYAMAEFVDVGTNVVELKYVCYMFFYSYIL